MSEALFADEVKALAKQDAVLRKVIKQVGDCTLVLKSRQAPYQSLIEAIAHQQLHGNAAKTILGRFRNLYASKTKFPTPAEILATPPERLREIGLSTAKTAAVLDVAKHAEEGIVPTLRQIDRLSDEEIIKRLIPIRGVGLWTVQMLLIFQLGRLDVWPVDDFGVRSGYATVHGLDEHPTKREMLAGGEVWRPYRSLAAWYLWRVADLAKTGAWKSK